MKSQNGVRIQFSIRMLLVFILCLAVFLVGAQRYSKYLRFKNSQPIDVVIADFNQRVSSQYNQAVGDGQSPLTPEQVIEFLDSDNDIITGAPPRVRAIFREITGSKLVPTSVRFDFISSSTGREIRAWLVGMEIMDDDARYRVNIRKIDVHTP